VNVADLSAIEGAGGEVYRTFAPSAERKKSRRDLLRSERSEGGR